MTSAPPKFEAPPLLCVLFSVKFDRLTDASEVALRLKKHALENGFPIPDINGVDTVEVKTRQDANPEITYRKIHKWDFLTEDKKALLRFDENSMTLLLAEYSHFSKARKILEKALHVISEAIPDLTTTRHGLRYVNYIPLGKDESPADWVNIGLLGLASQPELEMQRDSSVSETSFQTGLNRRYTVRCCCFGKGLTVPPDLFPLPLNLRFPATTELPFIRIENNHHHNHRNDFDLADSLRIFSELRYPVTTFFEAITTPHAHQTWQRLS